MDRFLGRSGAPQGHEGITNIVSKSPSTLDNPSTVVLFLDAVCKLDAESGLISTSILLRHGRVWLFGDTLSICLAPSHLLLTTDPASRPPYKRFVRRLVSSPELTSVTTENHNNNNNNNTPTLPNFVIPIGELFTTNNNSLLTPRYTAYQVVVDAAPGDGDRAVWLLAGCHARKPHAKFREWGKNGSLSFDDNDVEIDPEDLVEDLASVDQILGGALVKDEGLEDGYESACLFTSYQLLDVPVDAAAIGDAKELIRRTRCSFEPPLQPVSLSPDDDSSLQREQLHSSC